MTLDEALRVLGLEADATLDEVEKRYQVLVKSLHPDNNPVPGAELRFLLVQEAYDMISNANQKGQGEKERADKASQENLRSKRRTEESAQRGRQEKESTEGKWRKKARQEQQDSTANASAYYDRGIELGELGQDCDAIKAFNIAIGLKPDYYDAYLARAYTHQNIGHYADAINDFDELIRLEVRDYVLPVHYDDRGWAKYMIGQYVDAIKDFDEAIQLRWRPYYDTYRRRGYANYRLGQFAVAMKDFDEAIRLNYSCYEAYKGRGRVKEALGKDDSAKQDYAYSHYWHGCVRWRSGADAIYEFGKSIRLKPNFADAYRSRGYANSILGNFADAIHDYDEAIRLKPNEAFTYRYRGDAMFALGHYDSAIKDYDEAIRLNNNDVTTYNDRGLAKRMVGQFVAAIQDFDEAIRRMRDSGNWGPSVWGPSVVENRGVANFFLLQLPAAIDDFDEAIRLKTQNSEVYYFRGCANFFLGQFADAIKDFEKEMELETHENS